MNVKIIIITAVVTLIVTVLVGGGIMKYRFHHATPEKHAKRVVKMISWRLDLDDSQKAKLQDISRDALEKFREHRKSHKGDREVFKNLITKDNLTRDDLEPMVEKRKAAMEEMKPFIMDKVLEFHAMLKPEQKKKLAELVDRHHHRWHN